MLILTRGRDQVITIGDDIRITIVEIRNGKGRVGMDAPRDVQVMRSELVKRPEGNSNE